MTVIEQRSNFYALLSRVFISEFEKELLKSVLKNKELLEMMPSLKGEKQSISDNMDVYIEEILNVDFTNLFLLHLTPYESFFKREDGMMNTGGSNPVVQFYEKYDFQIDLSKGRVIAADQIGCELEFMHVLTEGEGRAIQKKDETAQKEIMTIQKEFLKEHLLSWAPLFLNQVKKEAETSFYRDFADLAIDFLFSDYEYINDKLSL